MESFVHKEEAIKLSLSWLARFFQGGVLKETLFSVFISPVINFPRPNAVLFLKPHPERRIQVKTVAIHPFFLMGKAVHEKKKCRFSALPGAMQSKCKKGSGYLCLT